MENDSCDVTLVCEDRQLNTHKVIISSCSPILRNILKINQNQHPLIYLRKVKYRNLQSLLNFMYQGEVNVAEEDLPGFLEIAEDLKIKGLSEVNKEDFDAVEDDTIQFSQKNIQLSPNIKGIVENNKNTPSTKPKEYCENLINKDNKTKICTEMKSEETSILSHKKIISTLVVHDVGKPYPCQHCEYETKRLTDLKKHIRSIHEGERFPCENCDYKATDKSRLTKHVKSIHLGERYPCDQCEYKATLKDNLRTHRLKYHM